MKPTKFILAIALALVIYIMINHLGLNDALDFGAGAYYYADIPGFEKWFGEDHYTSQIPDVIIILLFMVWGAVMYRLWLLLDKNR